MTHAYATLEVSPAVYDEIAGKLRAAEYRHAITDGLIDMHGIALQRAPGAVSGAIPGAASRYVVGFLFWRDEVLLIRKARPEWQRGRLNGVGGKIEAGETPERAMCREFLEETGIVSQKPWHHFVTLTGDRNPDGKPFEVYFFCAYAAHKRPKIAQSPDVDEPARWVAVDRVPRHVLVLSSLRWLIPMAYDGHSGEWPYLIREASDAGRHDDGLEAPVTC